MRLHMMCLTIFKSLTYLNVEETTLTCYTKERTWTTEKDEYLTEMIHHLNEYNDRRGKTMSSKKIKGSVLQVME